MYPSGRIEIFRFCFNRACAIDNRVERFRLTFAFFFASVLGTIGVFALAARFALARADMFSYGNTAFVIFPERDYFELNAVDVAVAARNFNMEEVVARGEVVYAERIS